MTTLGLAFVALFAVSLVRGRRFFAVALCVSLPFNDSAAVVAGGFTLSAYYLGLFIYVALFLLDWVLQPKMRPTNREQLAWAHKALIWFLLWCLVITALAPGLFSGFGVVAPGIGLDEQVGDLSSLGYSPSNVAQLLYLTLNVALILIERKQPSLTRLAFRAGFSVGVLTALASFSGAFPQALFDNSPRGFYAVSVLRLRGQFSEPSHLGAFALAALVFFVFELVTASWYVKIWAVLMCFGCAVLIAESASGTAIAGLVAAYFLILVVMAVRSRSATPREGSAFKALALLNLTAVSIVAAILVVPIAERLIAAKQSSTASFKNRSLADEIAISLFERTRGLGTGLGSNRASSLLTQMLSTVGLIGTCLFLSAVLSAVSIAVSRPERLSVGMSLLAFVVTAMISIADFAAPVLWLSLAFCAQAGLRSVGSTWSQANRAHYMDRVSGLTRSEADRVRGIPQTG